MLRKGKTKLWVVERRHGRFPKVSVHIEFAYSAHQCSA
jgi:hypothetical protein